MANRDLIKATVEETVDELIRQGYITGDPKKKYISMSRRLHEYYGDGELDDDIREAIRKVESDFYFRIITLYYSSEYTNEQIAEILNCSTDTVIRNKRRLVNTIADHYRRGH